MSYDLPTARPLTSEELRERNEEMKAGANGKPKRKRSQLAGIAQPENQTDIANAERFVKRFGDRVRFVPEWEKYLTYTGTHWREDAAQVTCRRYAKSIAKSVWMEVGATGTADAVKYAKRTASRAGMSATYHTAGPELAISPSMLDADPWAFNCINGTIDLRTGTLREHRREDYFTKCCPTAFDTAAQCPLWEETLLQVFASADIVAFVQRLCGWWLTGVVMEHLLLIAYGVGANGKSTFFGTLLQVWGDGYAMQAAPDLLMQKKGDAHPTERADLFGKRLVIASETENNARLAESLVKQLTGGDKIRARRMKENFWEFEPVHKLALATNYKPRVRGTDHAIWRRLLLLPFQQVFDGPRADKSLPAKLRAEAPGILAWAVRGCLAWQREGLNPPSEVQSATREYRSSQDVIGRFVSACCVAGSTNFSVRFSDFYAAMETWARDGGESAPGTKTVAQWLTDNGFESYQSGGRRYRGIGLQVE